MAFDAGLLVSSAYWNGLLGWLKETILAEGNIGPEELELFQVADDQPRYSGSSRPPTPACR